MNSITGQVYGTPTRAEDEATQHDPNEQEVEARSRVTAANNHKTTMFPKSVPADPETLSASVDIEDLIDEYDEPSSRRSVRYDTGQTASTKQPQQTRPTTNGRLRLKMGSRQDSAALSNFSLNNLISSTQSYRTAEENEETMSFYSALNDGFSLDGQDAGNHPGQEFFLGAANTRNTNSRHGERETMLRSSNFRVLWYDISYCIDVPRTKLSSVFGDIKRVVYDLMPSSFGISSRDGSDYKSANARDSKINDSKVPILQKINGSFKSGELTAVMGPSGAGKTSLLNILSRRREDGFSGQLCVESEYDSEEDERSKIRINSIPQHDHLPGYLTVRESLMFASRLKNYGANHEENVLRASSLLGLEECLDTKTKNISGGQQKRLAIAQELLSRPDILILDEPTSGLDSSTCIMTLSVLKDLVRASAKKIIDPIAVVLTIHQPQQEAFELFDKVYVLATGGLAIYDGPPSRCAEFVQKHTGISMLSPDYNPASFMIDIASGEYGQEPIRQLVRQVRIEFEKMNVQKNERLSKIDNSATLNEVTTLMSDSIEASKPQDGQNQSRLCQRLVKGSAMNGGKFFYKTRVLTERCWLSMTRDSRNTLVRIAFHLILPFGMALLVGTDAGRINLCPKYRAEYPLVGIVKSDEFVSPEVQAEFMMALENLGIIFITIYSSVSANIVAMTLMFTLDLQTSLKEYYNGWYSMNSYILARILSNIPLDLILPTTTMALLYVATGQNTGEGDVLDIYRIMVTALAVVLGSLAGEMMGMLFGAIYMGHATTAIFASQGATLPFVLLSGFVARTKNMSLFVRELSYISFYRHCLEISFIARYGWNVCACDPGEMDFREPTITGVPEKLKKFIDYWRASQQDQPQVESNSSSNRDVFQMMAKQVSSYNTYGIEVKSCEQVVPHQLIDFELSEKDLPYSFAALIATLVVMLLSLILVVKVVTRYRTSL